MQIALSTGSLYKYPLAEVLHIASTTGFDGIELLIGKNNCTLNIQEIQDLSYKYKMPVLSIHSPFTTCKGWGEFWDRIWRSIIIAMMLSVTLINFHTKAGIFPRHIINDELSKHVETYKEALKDSNIILTIENLPTVKFLRQNPINRLFPHFLNNLYKLPRFSKANGIHITFDTTHIGTTGIPLIKAYSLFRDRIANVHLSDYDGNSQHLLPGKGKLPLKDLLSQLKHDGYNGIVTLETHPDAMEYKDRLKVLKNAERSLKYIKDAL